MLLAAITSETYRGASVAVPDGGVLVFVCLALAVAVLFFAAYRLGRRHGFCSGHVEGFVLGQRAGESLGFMRGESAAWSLNAEPAAACGYRRWRFGGRQTGLFNGADAPRPVLEPLVRAALDRVLDEDWERRVDSAQETLAGAGHLNGHSFVAYAVLRDWLDGRRPFRPRSKLRLTELSEDEREALRDGSEDFGTLLQDAQAYSADGSGLEQLAGLSGRNRIGDLIGGAL